MPDGYQSDGEDIAKALRGDPWERSTPQFWHYPSTSPSLGVRIGDWKLLTTPDGQTQELYNLANDNGEKANLAGDRPIIVKSLRDPLMTWYLQLPLAKNSR